MVDHTQATDAQRRHRTAIIDVGGGFRAIYGCGVEDRCLEDDIMFDHCYGISAGSANLTSYIARQHGRNHTFYTEYAFRKEYASFDSFVRNHNYANLEYVYSTLSNHDGEYPVDYEAFAANPAQFTVVACNADDGTAHYFDKSRVRFDDFDIMKASSAVPVACQPYVVDGVPYYDGGIADPIPVQKAFDDGCDRVVVVLSRPKDFHRDPKKDVPAAKLLHHSHPAAAERMLARAQTYNDELDFANRCEAEDGTVLVLAPDDLCGLSTLSKTFEGMERMYRKGYAAAGQIADFLNS
ncbi:patatin-like phospholipase family protein [Bifidobacterium choloepi]|uniref:Patatin family protein n=1 Tax=Bifidobacterium choloepi TaxID=2614131 RepID=A0A6I5NJR6_9BIFI|nr:patatin family protein [Bifidobacterium choloepi]NEG70623.1 patatin family protein [Bifidobacterium choloepi]